MRSNGLVTKFVLDLGFELVGKCDVEVVVGEQGGFQEVRTSL